MRAVLGTIALEPNRWSGFPRVPAMRLDDLLPRVADAGFDKLEVWQWHASTLALDAVEAVRAKGDELGVRFPVIGVYPTFHAEGDDAEAARAEYMGLIDRAKILGTTLFKIMLGSVKGSDVTPEQLDRTTERLGEWLERCRDADVAVAAELHGGTLFDPVDVGEQYLADHPEFDIGVCFQPYDFSDRDAAFALAERFAGRIVHIHLQAPASGESEYRYSLLEECPLDYRTLLPKLVAENPDPSMTLEFVKGCVQTPIDLDVVVANARKDAEFVEDVLGG